MSTFEAAIGPLLNHEGGRLVPQDHNRGSSKWGVTLATYHELVPSATDADIAALGPEQASAFYRRMFWERYHLGLIEDQAVATKLLDLAVNMGGGTAVKLLQRAIGTPPDGALGPKTAELVNGKPGAAVLDGLRNMAAQYYRELVDRRPEWKPCLAGWISRLNEA